MATNMSGTSSWRTGQHGHPAQDHSGLSGDFRDVLKYAQTGRHRAHCRDLHPRRSQQDQEQVCGGLFMADCWSEYQLKHNEALSGLTVDFQTSHTEQVLDQRENLDVYCSYLRAS